ncbi:ABC transporter family substrate-binding protein [Dactylosporangium matsuzakiense]|uniref:ABC transporter substrate-binding protein n=1 Tax=Dactylosporangium matsuzakiense TaxID=53360 RepID=A0A9W6KBY4_9ACTN|nr:ABC transporter family substrate-binding protein [Dactylosporangium matsuzakiense]GLK99310.1 ABC transporter substrate-binding protein [Dactylosporangium matsuzakiense]
MRNSMAPALGLLLAASVLVAGCDGGSTPADQGAAPKTGSADINPKPRESLRKGGTLRLSIQQWITQYNVGQVDGLQGDASSIMTLTEPKLFFADDNGVPVLNADVLVSADVTSTGTQVVTYRLNPKATWSDGAPITWRDFETEWKTRNGSDARFQVSGTTGYDAIASVERGADDRTAKVTFKTRYADWQSLFDPLLPGSALDTPEEFNTGWIEKIPVWGGPWKIGTADKTSQTITVVPNERYWGTRPILDSIVYRALDSTAITEAYLNNEIDQAPGRQAEAYQRLAGAPDTVIRTGGRWDETQLTIGHNGPLSDERVRQAIQNAVDRRAVAAAQSSGLPFKVNTLGSHFFMPSQDGYRDNSGDYGRFDLDRAKRLLDEAGWKAGADGARSKDGAPLKLSYVVNSQGSTELPQLVQNQLAQSGIAVELRKVPANDYFAKYVNVGAFDLASFRQVDNVFPSLLYPVYRSNGEQNYGGVGSPDIDKLIDQAGAETDRAKAVELLNQADGLLWKAGHSVPLFQTPQISAVRPNLANFGAFGLRSERQYVDVGFIG